LSFAFAIPRESLRSFHNFAASLGTSGLFTAIVCCLATAGAIMLYRRRFPGDKGTVFGALTVWIGSFVLYALHVSIGAILAAIISPLGSLGDSFLALFLIAGIESVLWLFGIHGPALLAALVLPVYLNFQFANTAAYAHGQPLPYIVAVSTFLFVFPGGTGATLPLVVLLLRSRVPRLRKFALATIVPSFINTNEPVMFGLPVVYNPILGIPYVLAPLALVCTTYAAMALHLVRAPVYYVPMTVPIFINVFLATFDWRSIPLLALNLALATAIYFPFVRMYERAESQRS
jgi:PTS system cellobiose-specific IIC component